MKSRKTKMFVALGLTAISGFLLMAVSFADEAKNIKLDITNARQTIPVIHFRSNLRDKTKFVELKNVGNLVRINTKEYNFVLRKGNSEASGKRSTILGGQNNKVNGDYSTIIAGNNNQVSSSYGTIGGGQSNNVDGGYGTVAGGQGNAANTYSTVVGGSENMAGGNYAVALGNNVNAIGNNSVAMGKNATVNKENSFLWNDGTSSQTLNSDNTFAVVGANGMVVNKNKAHRFAQLTIGGSLIINYRGSDANTCNSTTKGVVKVVGGSHSQACFCSCNGSKRSSLYGGGDCSSKCDTSITPKCDNNNLIKFCNTNPYTYSGHCLVGRGEVVEGDGAYMVDKDGKIHWTCQTNDGKTDHCVGEVTSTVGTCTEPNPEANCSGGYDEDKAEFVAGSDQGFEGIINATLYNRLSDVPSGTKCAWYCKNGYYKKGDICAPMEGCDEFDDGDRHIPHLDHGETKTINNIAGTCTRVVSCDNGTPTLGTPTCYSCQGPAPSNALLVAGSDQGLSSNVDRTLYANFTAAAGKKCAYLCDLSRSFYYKNGSCSFKIDWCNNDTLNGCESPASATHQDNSDPSKSTWDCAIDGTTMEMGCYKCKDGYVDKGNGVCQKEAITINICPKAAYGNCTASALKNCRRGGSLSNLSFEADQLLPKNIDIQVDLTYHYQDPGLGVTQENGCSYLNEDVNPVYTIANGEKTSDNGGGVFSRYNTMCVSSYGYKKYFDSSFDYNFKDTSSKVYGFTLNGQEYILNLNGICGTTTGDITPEEGPKCGSANNTNRSEAPSTQAEKCGNGSPSTISQTSDGWTWTCSKDGVTTNPPCIAYKEPVCGTSNGKTVSSMPTGTAACNPGNRARPITGDTQFTWNCGLGPKTVPCSANREQSYPQCGSAHQTNTLNKPTQGLCSGGTASEVVEGVWSDLSETVGGWRGDAPIWKWSCSNGTQTDDGCYAVIPYAEIGCEGVNGSAVDFGTETFGSTSSPDFKGIDFSFYVRYDCVDGSHIGESGEEVVNGYYDGTNNGGIWQGTAGKCGWINATRVNYVEIKSVNTREMDGFRLLPGDSCVNTARDNGCAAGWYGDYYISGYVSNGVTVDVTRTEGDLKCSAKMKCVYGSFQLQGVESCQGKCQGDHPEGVTTSDKIPNNNTITWFCATDTTQACSYTCPTGKQCNASNTDCIDVGYECQGDEPLNAILVTGSNQGLSSNVDRTLYANSTAAAGKKCAYLCDLSRGFYYKNGSCSFKIDWCKNDTLNGCESPSSATNQNNSDPSKSTWDCAIDGTTMEMGCYKCKDGYVDKGNGVCVSEYAYACHGECSTNTTIDPDSICRSISLQNVCTSKNFCKWNSIGSMSYCSAIDGAAYLDYDCESRTEPMCTLECYWSEDLACLRRTDECRAAAANGGVLPADCVDDSQEKCAGQEKPECSGGEPEPLVTIINICPKAVINEAQSAWGPDACYHGEVLNSLSYESSQALPTKVKITTTLNYYSLNANQNCNYRLTNKTNEYTIMTGNTESDPIKANQDALRLGSYWNFTQGYTSYFDPNFTQFVRPEIYKDSSGKQYEFVISDDCEPTSVESAKCGLAQSGTYTTSPNASLLCKKGEYSIPQNEGGKWTWTCTNGNSVAECRANVGSSQTLQCGTQKWTCIGGDVANKQGAKWNCVNGTESICCSYVCTPKTYSCPSGYRLTSDNKCELYMQFCVDDICGTSTNNHMCTSRDTSNCGSETCFGDATQAANGVYCDWGLNFLNYDETMSREFDHVGISFVGWMSTPGGDGVRGYRMSNYESNKEKSKCAPDISYSRDQILGMCPTLKSARSVYGAHDNGYYIDSEMCPSIPKFDACEEGGGECTVNKVANALCGGGVIDPPSIYVCTDACDQCYDTFGECMANKPGSATSNCILGTPNSALESQCYCYRPAATVPVCWFS